MSDAEGDFGLPDPDGNDADHPYTDPEEEPDPMTQPEPHNQPEPERAIEGPKPDRARFDVDTPSVGELYQMFPDALPKNAPDRRKRHLAAVPDPHDLDTLPTDLDEDSDDPLIATALRWRAALALWWTPTATAAVIVVIAICAFTVAGAVVGIAWCTYGIGWITYSIWHAHGRPSLRHIHHQRHGGNW
ncbi:hypothetical protein VMT65_31205 [Nocardia sp. CDC153]|uniref:hypothetical protein n=1 Tax=Nocardia sp. CDC153 TaxID=3112167 RepID=UPI002DBA3C62|nr:hypothetical protein [Nocardia sp. CDC153]MEC3957538.1 hypothetical protein [Nocardia sp. CDC153]